MNIVGFINLELVFHHDPRDPGGPRFIYRGHDDAGNPVRHRTIKRLLRRIIKTHGGR